MEKFDIDENTFRRIRQTLEDLTIMYLYVVTGNDTDLSVSTRYGDTLKCLNRAVYPFFTVQWVNCTINGKIVHRHVLVPLNLETK